jgi:hypothetical protein
MDPLALRTSEERSLIPEERGRNKKNNSLPAIMKNFKKFGKIGKI